MIKSASLRCLVLLTYLHEGKMNSRLLMNKNNLIACLNVSVQSSKRQKAKAEN